MKKYYKILGLPMNASQEEMRNARNNLLKKYHPDCYSGSSEYAQIKTAEINQAFDEIMSYLETQEQVIREKARQTLEKEKKKEEAASNKQRSEIVQKVNKQEEEHGEKYEFFATIVWEKIKSFFKKKEISKTDSRDNKNNNSDIFSNQKSEYKEEEIKNLNSSSVNQEEKMLAKEKVSIEINEQKAKKHLDIWIYSLVLVCVVLLVLFLVGIFRK